MLDYSRNYQVAVGKPGEKYNYSDTGYILLGMLIENITEDSSFDVYLHEKILSPLQMDDSYLFFYSEPVNGTKPIADVWLEGTNIKAYKSLSIDWVGGEIISTLKDLSIFV